MPSRARIGARSGQPRPVDVSSWTKVDLDALSGARRTQFIQRRDAITMYAAGATDDELREATGLTRKNVSRLTRRCLETHPDGTLMGWRGALPYFRVQAYHRRSEPEVTEFGGGAVGALRWLFEAPGGPDLEKRFREQILGRTPKLASARRPKKELFLWFIRELRQAGLEARQQWPFNVEKLGYVTICKFIDRVMNENPRRKRELLGGEEAQRKAKAGDGTGRPDLKAFDRVECDAHKLDARMIVQIPSPHGGYVERVIHRLWVVVIIEVATRVVLGYRLSLRRECGAEDVLRAIKSALTRWQPRELQFSGHAYDEDAGVPSARHERYVGACWDEFSVDGAMANICGQVEAQLRDVVGARLLKPQDPTSFSCRRSKDDRPFVESFFKRLASGGFHRLSSTTGSKPQDKRGGDPDRAAVETKFQLEYAEELLDTFIANYNATPHSGLSYRSPLEQLDFETTRRSAKIRIADPWDVKRLVGLRKLCTVLGGTDTGRRPHFNFANARYSAEWLCLRTDLVGKLLWVQVEDEDDARYAMVSTRDGQFLGAVRAAPPWHLTPHTL